jgi:aminoglycoside 6'-N-acetyltransferase
MAGSVGSERVAVTHLHGERVTLRPTRPQDAERLWEIVNEPGIAATWWPHTLSEAREHFVAEEGSTHRFVIETCGYVVGLIQYEEETDPDYRHAAIDIFVATSRQRRGIGTEALRLLAAHLFDLGHHRLTIDPATNNEPAIRAYERVGFRRVGVMRRAERGPDGTWHDGLLMDMLREDFEEPNRS